MPAFQTSLFAFQGANQFAFQTEQQVTEITQPVTGGWEFFVRYEQEITRRRKRRKELDELEEQTREIQDATDREIALLLRKQEEIDERRKDLERLGIIAKQNADLETIRQYGDKVLTAFERALRQGNYSALEALDRELKRAFEEEEFLLLSMLILLK